MKTLTLAAPINVTVPTYNREKILKTLQKAGIKRIILCGQTLTTDQETLQKTYEKLPGEVAFYKKHGLEVWWWRWAFWLIGENNFTHVTSFEGTNKNEVCFLDPDFQKLTFDDIRNITATGVDGFLYDDDFRYDNGGTGLGCLCPRHLALAEKIYGKPIPMENLEKEAFYGKPNALRSALMQAWEDSLNDFARKSREVAASINPNVRFGMCNCLTGYDADGVTAMELTKTLAGNTRPFARLIGAPYWASHWKNTRINEIIEYERMQASFMPDDMEIFPEGDVWPRPRFCTPAANLEILDTATRFDGRFDGIMKYMFDYTSTMDYETGYLDKHLDNQPFCDAIQRLTDGMSSAGIRVFQATSLVESTDFSGVPDMRNYIDGPMMYPQAAYALAPHGIPTVYKGHALATICFGENARRLTPDFKQQPLILDIQAAKLLQEQGWDLGLRSIGKRFKPTVEHYPDGEEIPLRHSLPGSRQIKIASSAKVLSTFDGKNESTSTHFETDAVEAAGTARSKDAQEIASYSYEAADGAKYLVFNFEGTVSDESSWRNYRFPTIIKAFLTDCHVTLPAVLDSKCPDFYLQCKTDANSCVIGLWNCHVDYAKNVKIKIGKSYGNIECVSCTATLNGNELTVQHIAAHSFALVKLTKR